MPYKSLMPSTLTLRDLNRATLARQMLLEREAVPVPAAIERLVGLQAQLASAPFVGLWSRLKDFKRETLAKHLEGRAVVKATFIRATLHLVTAADYVRFRTVIQPLLSAGVGGHCQGPQGGLRSQQAPCGREEVPGQESADVRGDQRVGDGVPSGAGRRAMRYAIRTHLPLIQVPVPGGWCFPAKPEFTLAEPWIGKPCVKKDYLSELLLRYLAGYGPATVADAQSALGYPKLKDAFEKLKPDLVTFHDERKRELFDIPNQFLPGGDVPTPVRFLSAFDNLLLMHANRTRVIADEHRPKVYLPGLRVAATVLVDGFVAGVWKIEKTKTAATLVVEPFGKWAKKDRTAAAEEAERLVRFVEPDGNSFSVNIE